MSEFLSNVLTKLKLKSVNIEGQPTWIRSVDSEKCTQNPNVDKELIPDAGIWQIPGKDGPSIAVGDLGRYYKTAGWTGVEQKDDYVVVFFPEQERWPFHGPMLTLHLGKERNFVSETTQCMSAAS